MIESLKIVVRGKESNPAITPASAPGFPYLPFDPDTRHGALLPHSATRTTQ